MVSPVAPVPGSRVRVVRRHVVRHRDAGLVLRDRRVGIRKRSARVSRRDRRELRDRGPQHRRYPNDRRFVHREVASWPPAATTAFEGPLPRSGENEEIADTVGASDRRFDDVPRVARPRSVEAGTGEVADSNASKCVSVDDSASCSVGGERRSRRAPPVRLPLRRDASPESARRGCSPHPTVRTVRRTP